MELLWRKKNFRLDLTINYHIISYHIQVGLVSSSNPTQCPTISSHRGDQEHLPLQEPPGYLHPFIDDESGGHPLQPLWSRPEEWCDPLFPWAWNSQDRRILSHGHLSLGSKAIGIDLVGDTEDTSVFRKRAVVLPIKTSSKKYEICLICFQCEESFTALYSNIFWIVTLRLNFVSFTLHK